MRTFDSLSSRLTLALLLVCAPLPFALANTAHAGAIEETWIVDHLPNEAELQDWAKKPGQRRYRLSLEDPSASELESLVGLPRATRVEVQLPRLPSPDMDAGLRRLAEKFRGQFDLVIFDGNLPAAAQPQLFERLDGIGASQLIFVITAPQDPADTAALARFRTPTKVNYPTRVYPRYADRPSWDTIPATVPVTLASDYWPLYTAMDLMNLMQSPLRLRVRDSFPTSESIPYVRGIRRLEEVTLDTDFDPSGSFQWTDLGPVAVRWTRRFMPPMQEAMNQFCNGTAGQNRKLILDRDDPLAPEDFRRLQACADRIPVEWIHAP